MRVLTDWKQFKNVSKVYKKYQSTRKNQGVSLTWLTCNNMNENNMDKNHDSVRMNVKIVTRVWHSCEVGASREHRITQNIITSTNFKSQFQLLCKQLNYCNEHSKIDNSKVSHVSTKGVSRHYNLETGVFSQIYLVENALDIIKTTGSYSICGERLSLASHQRTKLRW